MITEHLPVVLFNTCGGSIESIKALILNKNADLYCRISVCRAIAYGVAEECIPRKEVLRFLETFFTVDEEDQVSNFWNLLATFVCDLYPEEPFCEA